MNLNNLTISEFKDFVGNSIATAVFRKKDGSIRKMNFRLKVVKYVKGTTPEATAKRKETLTAQNMIGVYEMKGTSVDIEEKNYRTLNLDTMLGLNANGQKLVNEVANREDWEGWV